MFHLSVMEIDLTIFKEKHVVIPASTSLIEEKSYYKA